MKVSYEYHPENGIAPHIILWKPWDDDRTIWLAYTTEAKAKEKMSDIFLGHVSMGKLDDHDVINDRSIVITPGYSLYNRK